MSPKIKVEITRFIDNGQPGFVECRLIDAQQREWFFEEKVPVVTTEELDSTSVYPRLGTIACCIIGSKSDGMTEIIRVDTSEPWSISSVCGETQFEIFPEQLQED